MTLVKLETNPANPIILEKSWLNIDDEIKDQAKEIYNIQKFHLGCHSWRTCLSSFRMSRSGCLL